MTSRKINALHGELAGIYDRDQITQSYPTLLRKRPNQPRAELIHYTGSSFLKRPLRAEHKVSPPFPLHFRTRGRLAPWSLHSEKERSLHSDKERQDRGSGWGERMRQARALQNSVFFPPDHIRSIPPLRIQTKPSYPGAVHLPSSFHLPSHDLLLSSVQILSSSLKPRTPISTCYRRHHPCSSYFRLPPSLSPFDIKKTHGAYPYWKYQRKQNAASPRPESYPYHTTFEVYDPPFTVYAAFRRPSLFGYGGARQSSPPPARPRTYLSVPLLLWCHLFPFHTAQRRTARPTYALERLATRPVGLPPPTCIPRREERRVSQPEFPEADPELE